LPGNVLKHVPVIFIFKMGIFMESKINIKWILRHIAVWIPAVCIMVIIFYFSSMVADDSSDTSMPIAELVIRKIEQFMDITIDANSESYGLVHHCVRKAGHFLEYTALGCTLVLPFAFICPENFYRLRILLYSETFAAFYACTDEFHQLFVEGRDGNFIDVGIDSLGAFTGICAGFIFWWIGKKVVGIVNKN